MITGLISTVLGMVGGVVPDIMKEFKASREHTREMAMIDKQAETSLKLAQMQTDGKLRELEGSIAVEEMRAFRAQMENIYKAQAVPSGVRWVDAWNAALRPGAVSSVIVIFSLGSVAILWGVWLGYSEGTLSASEAGTAILGGVLGEYIQAVWGYLFGYRSSSAAVQAIRNARKRD